MIYIGAENIISPIGKTAFENFENLKKGNTGIKFYKNIGFDEKDLYLSKIEDENYQNAEKKFDYLIINSIQDSLSQAQNFNISDENVLILISSTKGNIDKLNIENEDFSLVTSALNIQQHFNLKHTPKIISNACISGIMAINTANNLIESGMYKHIIVTGADIVSDFVLWGFQSLFAISDEPCQPFDKNRKGITMGEAVGTVIVSEDEDIFKEKPLKLLAGVSTNDANHISGPSRTGEGLFRAIQKTLSKNNIKKDEIDFISGHGTATNFNDEMESIAFSRLEMLEIPINSLKAFYGHTLGAAGLIESIISMQSIRQNVLIKSLGFEEEGTSHTLNLLKENKETEVNCILKTAAGFGGCNAALIIKK